MRLGVEGPLPLRSSALLPRNPTTTIYYRLAYFYSATLAWFYSALDRFEWLFLQPYTPRSPRPVADDRAARTFIANTLNRVRTYPPRADEEDRTPPGGPLSYLVGY